MTSSMSPQCLYIYIHSSETRPDLYITTSSQHWPAKSCFDFPSFVLCYVVVMLLVNITECCRNITETVAASVMRLLQ